MRSTSSAWNAMAAGSSPGCGPDRPAAPRALNAAIWHTWKIGAPVKRSLIAYDH
jgi:hypothetical protein